MRTAPRSRRAALAGATVALIALIVLATASTAQEENGSAAIPSQDGWWNRLQGPQEGEPATPIRDVLSPAPPPPNTVPDDGLAVGAAGGDPDKVAAIGIVLEAPSDAFVDRLVLGLEETDDNGSNVNEGQATVLACPITTFWAGTANGNWQNRPECDDGQAVEGERADDGTWTFDLGLIAQSWVDGTLTQLGVLLIEGADAPQSFQVSYRNIDSGGVSVDFATTGGGTSGSSIFAPDPEPAPSPAPPPASTDFDRGPVAAAPRRPAPTTPPTTEAAAPSSGGPARPAAAPTLDADIWGDLPLGAILWLPLALGAAGALAVVLGPQGRPGASARRVGSVSRVLDARPTAR